MTQIRRSAAKPMALPILRILILVSLILSFTVFLFQLDAFPQRKSKKTAMTPDKLVQQQPLAAAAVRQRAAAVPEKTITDSKDVETRRYVMELGNLKGSPASGKVILETYTSWAPLGANHFHKLVEHEFYNNCRFFRVVNNFVVQFGMAANPSDQWKDVVLQDDPVTQTNAVGTLTYATSGPNTRTTQLFINTRKQGNAFLDKQGFAPFGKVIQGMEFIEKGINAEYGEKPNQGKIGNQGNAYLQEHFPNLSYVVSIREMDDDDDEENVKES